MEKLTIASDERRILEEWRLLKKCRKGDLHIVLEEGWVRMLSSVLRSYRTRLNLKKTKKR